MVEFLRALFDTSDFPARWHCGNWSAGHGWLHIVSDGAIFAAYLAIPAVLAYFLMNRRDVPFPRVAWLFVGFIGFCGTTHLVEAIIFYEPVYRVSGVMKLGTAVISWATVASLVPIVPRALSMRSPESLEREVAERTRELKREKARLEAVLESIASGVLVARSDGSITLQNDAAAALVGPEVDARTLADPIRDVLEGRLESADCDATLAAEGADETRFLQASARRVNDGDDVEDHDVVVVLTDVTSRVRTEKELARSNKDLEQFAYVASHDLKEPLRMVSSFTTLLSQEYGEVVGEEGRGFIRHAVDGATRMGALIDDLLTYSRLGTRAAKHARVELDEVVADAMIDLRAAITAAEAKVEIGPLPAVVGDRGQLRQLFQNLIANAVKFGRPDSPPSVRVRGEVVDGDVVVEVVDDGIGIAPEHHERVFRVFTRLHARDKFPGTGIGLAICERVAQAHGGELSLTSALGEGTTFRITLPATNGRATDAADS